MQIWFVLEIRSWWQKLLRRATISNIHSIHRLCMASYKTSKSAWDCFVSISKSWFASFSSIFKFFSHWVCHDTVRYTAVKIRYAWFQAMLELPDLWIRLEAARSAGEWLITIIEIPPTKEPWLLRISTIRMMLPIGAAVSRYDAMWRIPHRSNPSCRIWYELSWTEP